MVVVDEVRFCFGEGGGGWVVPEPRRMKTRARRMWIGVRKRERMRARMRARRMLH